MRRNTTVQSSAAVPFAPSQVGDGPKWGSPVRMNTLNPEWSLDKKAHVGVFMAPNPRHDALQVRLFDLEGNKIDESYDDPLGHVTIPLAGLYLGQTKSCVAYLRWQPLGGA